VIYGSAASLTSVGDQFWSQNSPGVAGTAEADDSFGWSLAAANFENIAHDDLLVGVPGEDVGDVKDAGADQVLDGSADGLTSSGNELWTQDSSGITSRAEEEDAFGFSAARVILARAGTRTWLSIPAGGRRHTGGRWRREGSLPQLELARGLIPIEIGHRAGSRPS